MAHEPGAAGQRHEFALETDQAARRNAVLEAHAALAVRLHVLQIATAAAQLFHHGTLVGFFDVDRQHFERLALYAVQFAEHHARTRHRQLIAFAAHVFEQDRQVQLAATRDEKSRASSVSSTRSATLLISSRFETVPQIGGW